MNATSRWLAGGSFFEPYQLAGPVPHPDGRCPVRAERPARYSSRSWCCRRSSGGRSRWASRPGPSGAPAGAGLLAVHRLLPVLAADVARMVAGNPVMWVLAASHSVPRSWPSSAGPPQAIALPVRAPRCPQSHWWIALAVGDPGQLDSLRRVCGSTGSCVRDELDRRRTCSTRSRTSRSCSCRSSPGRCASRPRRRPGGVPHRQGSRRASAPSGSRSS